MSRKKAYPTRLYVRILAFIVFTFFARIYNIKKKMPKEVLNLKSPYLVLSNHIGYWDPFLIGIFLPRFIHFVSSDAAFRNPVVRFFLTRLGTIPKKKNIRDTKVIRDIAAVIMQGENVGIFPEAVRNWAGKTQPVDKSVAKLIKMLKVPVVVPIIKGMNLFNPRWSTKLRHTKVEVEYTLLFSKEDIDILSTDKIFEQLNKALQHDEVAWQMQNLNKVRSKHKAEYINHALYVCPECLSIDSFKAKGNDFYCTECNYDIRINKYSFFERITKGKLHFDNIRDWFDWEEKYMLNFINEKVNKNCSEVIFADKRSKVYKSNQKQEMEYIDDADIKFYIDKIVIVYYNNESFTINYDDLQTINPQVKERLEIFYNNEAYRIIGGRPGVSALKWEVAVNAVWKKMGQEHKLSAYIYQ